MESQVVSRSISFLTLCVLGSSLQLCCYYDYYDASAINGEGEYGIGRGVVCGVARSRDILVYNGGYGAFVLPSFVRCPADGQAACMPRKYHLLFTTNSLSCLTQGSKTAVKLGTYISNGRARHTEMSDRIRPTCDAYSSTLLRARPKPRPRGAINHVYINLGARQILPGKRSDRVQPGHNKCSRNANEESEDGRRRRSRLHFHFLKMGK